MSRQIASLLRGLSSLLSRRTPVEPGERVRRRITIPVMLGSEWHVFPASVTVPVRVNRSSRRGMI
ncbi:MAG: hypothetical protein ACE5IK_03495 [Acidobacteriota bacterium]